MHLVFIPAVDGLNKQGEKCRKVSAKEFWKGKTSYKNLQNSFYKYVSENGAISTIETVELLDVKQRRARAILSNMVKDGYLRKEGAARSTTYVKNTEGK